MARWPRGEAQIESLLGRGDLEHVGASRVQAEAWLSQARANLGSSELIKVDNPTAAYVLCYDAVRLSIAAMLVNQGLRATRKGGHVAVFDAAVAQLGERARPFARMRRRRNDLEYPSPDSVGAVTEDVDEVLQTIPPFLQALDHVLDQMPVFERSR